MDSLISLAGFELTFDRYDGLTLELNSFKMNKAQFEEKLPALIEASTVKGYRLLWIWLDIKQSELIGVATNLGFDFHTCHEKSILLVKRLVKNAIIPTASNHTLGVGVVVINDNDEVLLIKERHSTVGFKLPGGHIDDGELITQAVQREVKEETGIDVRFENIVSISHLFPHQFKKSNLYIVCKAKPLSSQISIEDTQEILECQWIKREEFLQDENASAFVKTLIQTAQNKEGLTQQELELFKNFSKSFELFF